MFCLSRITYLKILILCFIFLSSFDVKIGIFTNKKVDELKIDSSSNIFFNDKTCNNQIRLTPSDKKVKLICNKKSFISENFLISSNDLLILKTKNLERKYLGKIFVLNYRNFLKIINIIDLENYVIAVTQAETKAMKNIEAIKANSVAIRSYTLSAIKRHISDGYNLCDLTHCQLYAGFTNISDKVRNAVEQTKGLIITYKGKPIWAMYHSVCGGITEDAFDVWGYDTMPYLVSVKDRINGFDLCSDGWGYRWRTKISTKRFQEFLRKNVIKKNEKFITIGDLIYTKSGRVKYFEIITDKRQYKISGIAFYHLSGRYFGWLAIKSTSFKIFTNEKYIIFEGNGYGHGVGMCQAGADKMAELGYNYKDILRHYYKGIKIESVGNR